MAPGPKPVHNKHRSRHEDEWDEKRAERREKREVEDLHARAASLQQQLDELQRGEGGASAATQIDSRTEKEQVKQLQRELKEERKKVAELDAKIAEQVVARERAEIELAKLEEEEETVAESEKAVAVLEEELKIKQEEVEEVNGKIKILEGTLERLRKRESGAEHDNGSLDLSARESCEAVAGDNLDKPSQPTSASHTSSLEPQVPAARIESDLGEPSYQNYQQELKRLREQTLAEQRKAEELEARLRELEEEALNADADSRSSTPRPPPSSASALNTSFAVQRLLKTITDANQTVNELREENMALLMQLSGVSA